MDPRDWNSYLAGEAAVEEQARELVAEATDATAASAESGAWEVHYRYLLMRRIHEVSTDPRPGHD
jgi:hypothetical protein